MTKQTTASVLIFGGQKSPLLAAPILHSINLNDEAAWLLPSAVFTLQYARQASFDSKSDS